MEANSTVNLDKTSWSYESVTIATVLFFFFFNIITVYECAPFSLAAQHTTLCLDSCCVLAMSMSFVHVINCITYSTFLKVFSQATFTYCLYMHLYPCPLMPICTNSHILLSKDFVLATVHSLPDFFL